MGGCIFILYYKTKLSELKLLKVKLIRNQTILGLRPLKVKLLRVGIIKNQNIIDQIIKNWNH